VGQALTEFLPQGRRNEDLVQFPAQDLVAAILKGLLGRGIEFNHPALVIDGDNGIQSGVKDGPLSRLALLKGQLGLLARGDVLDAAFVVKGAAVGVPIAAGVVLHADDGAVMASQLHLELAHDAVVAYQGEPIPALHGADHQSLCLDAEEALEARVGQHIHQSRVGVRDFSVRSNAEQADRNLIEQSLVPGFGFPKGAALSGPVQRQMRRRAEPGVMPGRFQNVIVQAGLHR
jgi:hypothetical protein